MSSHQDSYQYSHPLYSESDFDPSLVHQFSYVGQLGPPAATAGDQSGYSPSNGTGDSIADLLEYHELEDLNRSFGYPRSDTLLPSTSLQRPGVGTVATYPTQYSADLPFHDYPDFDDSHQFSFTSQQPVYDPPLTSTSLHGTNAATMELPNLDFQRYSHFPPVATLPPNQLLAPVPLPSSPDRMQVMPSSAAAKQSTERRVVPRHHHAQSVSSVSSPDLSGVGRIIPQPRYTTTSISLYNVSDRYPPIRFNVENSERAGIAITDILDKTDAFSRLRNGAETFNMGKKTFTLRVHWPGYEIWSRTIAAMDWRKLRGPITRVKLAEAIATAVRDVLAKFRDKQCDPDCAQWNIGPNGIQLHQICLLELQHVSRGSWQPHLCLIEPPHPSVGPS